MIWPMNKPDWFLFTGACLEPEIEFEFEICSGSQTRQVLATFWPLYWSLYRSLGIAMWAGYRIEYHLGHQSCVITYLSGHMRASVPLRKPLALGYSMRECQRVGQCVQ